MVYILKLFFADVGFRDKIEKDQVQGSDFESIFVVTNMHKKDV